MIHGAEDRLEELLAGVHPCQGICEPRIASLPPGMLMCTRCWHQVPEPVRRRVYVAVRANNRTNGSDRPWLRRAQVAAIKELRQA